MMWSKKYKVLALSRRQTMMMSVWLVSRYERDIVCTTSKHNHNVEDSWNERILEIMLNEGRKHEEDERLLATEKICPCV